MLVAPESLPRTQHTGNTDRTFNISLLDMPRSNQGNTSRSPDLDHSACDQSHQFPRQLLELEGTTVKNRLRLGSILGNGAFGVVYVGVGPRYANNRPVAVKVTSTARIDKERRRQIEYEILCHNRVSEHPNVVTLLGVLEDLSAKYSIMDLYSEGDLFKCITEDELYVGNDTMIKGVFSQLLDAVEFCHAKGVYHRDLKPENVLCSNRGNRVLLTDFGLATLHPLSKEFRCGSEFYMSPECMGFPKAEAYSTLHNDIWALGVILVNLITSRNPWRCADPADRAFALFREDPIGYIRSTLPVSPEVLALLLRIFKIPSKSRISIAGIRKAIGGMDRLLLTPSDAAAAPDAAYEAAVSLYGVIAARRPHLLADHYEDICVHYPELAGGLCANLKVQMAEHGLIDSVDDIFSEHASGVVYHVPQGLPEWSIPVEIRPEQLDEVSGYPQSPDMSRDNSTETIASGGPVTPATHPIQVVDEVPEIVLGEVDCVTEDLDTLKVDESANRTPVAPSGFSGRIARMLGSTGSFFSMSFPGLNYDKPQPVKMSGNGDLSRPLEDPVEEQPPSKRAKLVDESTPQIPGSTSKIYDVNNLLPPSTSLLGRQLPDDYIFQGSEKDVGITEYISHDISSIDGIIKQRFTDFLVHEVDLEGNVVHVRELGKPEGIELKTPPPEVVPETETIDGEWNASVDEKLSEWFAEDVRAKLKSLYEEGPEPPVSLVSDSGWEGRANNEGNSGEATPQSEEADQSAQSDRGRGRGRGKGRGRGRGGRGGGTRREDTRRVLTDPISSKEARTAVHQAVRTLFSGKFETETSETPGEEGSRVVIKWAHRGSGRRGRGGRGDRSTPRLPSYIHFTLQKTNRDTQDALSHLSRLLKVPARELSTAGTKDKRGVTTQRVCLKRGRLTVEDVWKVCNGLTGRRAPEDVFTQRGERGVRVSDIVYRRGYLELGMLKGNEFVITLRNVKAESPDIIDKAMQSLKDNGFINYYGMQRFGTSAIPTHSIGLALLRSDWRLATSLLLRPRPGEFSDTEAGRRAWLEGDLEGALRLIPRRCVAERAILENYKKHDGTDRNLLGGLSAIPRNLRLMYVHAYQSYVWNSIVSERIKAFGRSPVVGDVVYDDEDPDDLPAPKDDQEADDETVQTPADQGEKATEDAGEPADNSEKITKRWKSGKRFAPRKVKILSEEDLPNYSMFDIVMPLPGTDVAYPGGALGEKYREFLRMDGLDPDNFNHKQKDYALAGSYRKIIHHPKALTWTTMRYTDPNVPLAQSDEDAILGLDKPTVDEDGKFLALQVRLTLGTSAYATMALREVTKTETSSFHQTNLTLSSEDQAYRDTVKVGTEVAAQPAVEASDDTAMETDDLDADVPVEG